MKNLSIIGHGYKTGLETIPRGGDSIHVAETFIEFGGRRYGRSKLSFRLVTDYLRQFFALAGGNLSAYNRFRFTVAGVIGMFIDLLIFNLLISRGVTWVTSHIVSLLAATATGYLLNSYWTFKPETDKAYHPKIKRYFNCLTVAMLAIFLRGGALACLTTLWGWRPQAAIPVAVLIAAVIDNVGYVFFVFTRRNDMVPAAARWHVFALMVIGYTVLLRFVYSGLPELIQEEAYYWNYAMHPDIGYLDHPPMVAWIIRFGTIFFGTTEFAVRIGVFACWIITALFIYKLSSNIFNRSAAIGSVMLAATLPFFFGAGLVTTPDAPLAMCWAGALYFLERALVGEKRTAWWGACVCIGLGMLSKYTISLLAPATFLYMLIDRPSRRWFARPEPYIAALCALLLFSPVIWWNYTHDWASFVFQGPTRIGGQFKFYFPNLLLSICLLLSPTGFFSVFNLLLPPWKKLQGHSQAENSFYARRPFLYALIFSLVPLSVFIIFSFARQTKLNWTGPLWLVLLPFIAWQMIPGNFKASGSLQRQVQRAWPATIVAMMLFYGTVLHYFTIGLPGLPYPQNLSLLGWNDLGQQIEKIEDEVEGQTGTEPVVTGLDLYKTSSGLAFYRTKRNVIKGNIDGEGVQKTAGRNLFGKNSLMYSFWFSPEELKGATMIIVSDSPKNLMKQSLRDYFMKSGEPKEISVEKNGRKVGRYFYAVFEGYRVRP